MSLKIAVHSTDIRNFSGVSASTQKPFNMNFQTVYIFTSDRHGNQNPYPEKVEIILEKSPDGNPVSFQVGDYLLSDSSIYVDRYGSLAVKPLLLQQLKK
jgi:hypothetical protein